MAKRTSSGPNDGDQPPRKKPRAPGQAARTVPRKKFKKTKEVKDR
jgi:hypothetical protein